MSFWALSGFINGITATLLGIFVYLKNKKSPINITYALFCCSIAVWGFSYFIWQISKDEISALFWCRALMAGAIFIPIFYLHWLFYLLKLIVQKRKILIFGYMFAFTFLIFDFTPLFVKSVSHKMWFSYWPNAGILYFPFLIIWCGFVIYGVYIIILNLKSSSGIVRNQLKYILLASIAGWSGGATNYPLWSDINFPPIGNILVSAYILLAAYAIVKYRLMDISIVIKKGTVYTYLSLLVLIPCMLFIIFAQRFFFGKINYAFSGLVFVVFSVAAILFLKIKSKVEESIEKTLFKTKYEHKKTLTKLSKIVISFLDERKLFKKTSNIFIQDLKIESISFFLLDKRKGAYILRAFRNLSPKIRKFPQDDIFFKWLKENGQIIVKEELERFIDDPKNKLIVERLNSLESEVCIPLITRGELIGIVNLGKKKSGDMYSHEDLELLANFANQAAIALENARLYKDMKKTQFLMRRTDRLAALGSLTAGLAHEIRNPLVAVNTFLQLLPERFEDNEFREEFLKLTTSEVERITNLVNNLLDFARPSEPKLSKTDVNEIIKKVIDLIRVTAKKKDVIINTKLEKIPQTMLDEEQIKQVFLNILLNAIEAISNKGTISVTTISIQKNGLEYVQAKIEDTGKGIPKKILERIFDPFFTTKEKGSGLGLSISHHIVQEHNGFIEVESKLGKGTAFFVNLPCVE